MKLSSDRELLAEELYKLTADEYIESINNISNQIVNVYNNKNSEEEKINKITELSKAISTYRYILEAIYDLDADISQIETLIELSKQNKLFKVIYSVLEKDKRNIDIQKSYINEIYDIIGNISIIYKVII